MINKVLSEQVVNENSSGRSGYGWHYLKGIMATLFLVLGVPVAIYFVSQPTLLKLTASEGTAVLSIAPLTKTVGVGQSDSVEVWINPNGGKVSSIQLIINYDPTILEINDIRPGAFFEDNLAPPLELLKDMKTPGQIIYSLSFPSGKPQYSSTEINSVAVIEFTSLREGESPITAKVISVDGVNTFKNATEGSVVVENIGN